MSTARQLHDPAWDAIEHERERDAQEADRKARELELVLQAEARHNRLPCRGRPWHHLCDVEGPCDRHAGTEAVAYRWARLVMHLEARRG